MRPSRKGSDSVLALLVLGIWLLMPPAISLFSGARSLLGVPLLVIYLFGVWLGLIAATAWLSRRLPRGEGRLPGLPRRPEPFGGPGEADGFPAAAPPREPVMQGPE